MSKNIKVRKGFFLLFCFLLLWVSLFLSSCASAKKKPVPVLYGMIYDRDNRPVNNADVYVNGNYEAASDIHGHFALTKIKLYESCVVEVRKHNYESVSLDLAYTDPGLVVYVNMLSSEQLISEAEAALQKREWQRTVNFLDRAETAGGDMLSIQYLRAVLCLHRGDAAGSLELLTSLTEGGADYAFLYLFMADIYQYHLDDLQQAAVYLKRFLSIQYDADVQLRLDKMILEG